MYRKWQMCGMYLHQRQSHLRVRFRASTNYHEYNKITLQDHCSSKQNCNATFTRSLFTYTRSGRPLGRRLNATLNAITKNRFFEIASNGFIRSANVVCLTYAYFTIYQTVEPTILVYRISNNNKRAVSEMHIAHGQMHRSIVNFSASWRLIKNSTLKLKSSSNYVRNLAGHPVIGK